MSPNSIWYMIAFQESTWIKLEVITSEWQCKYLVPTFSTAQYPSSVLSYPDEHLPWSISRHSKYQGDESFYLFTQIDAALSNWVVLLDLPSPSLWWTSRVQAARSSDHQSPTCGHAPSWIHPCVHKAQSGRSTWIWHSLDKHFTVALDRSDHWRIYCRI